MVNCMKRYLKVHSNALDTEINQLDEIINILSDENSITDVEDKDSDIYMMKTRRNTFKDAKNVIRKASLEIDGLDNEVLMTSSEKKLFYKFIRFISFFRRIFKRK